MSGRRWIGSLLLAMAAVGLASAQGHTLQVTSPSNAAVINSSAVTVAFQVDGFTLKPSTVPLAEAGKRPDANRPGEGHLHFMLDLQPVVVWEQSEPYTFEHVAAGEHQLMVELVNNDHSSLVPPVVQHVRFRTALVMPEAGRLDPGWFERYGALLVGGTMVFGAGVYLRRTHRSERSSTPAKR